MPSPQPKPEPLKKLRARAALKKVRSRRACREIVYAREHWRCQHCSRSVTLSCHPVAPERAHVHEIVFRSLGGDPTDPANCQLLCGVCHKKPHRLRAAWN